MTVTATQGGSLGNGLALKVYVLTQAAVTQNGATSNNQFTAVTSFTQSVTTTQTGSRVYGVSAVFPNNSATAAALTTVVDNIADATNNARYVTFKATSLTGTPGATTLGFTVGSASAGPFAQAEILTAGTLTEDGSAPIAASTTGAGPLVSASFTPPDGALLVALMCSGGGVGVTTMTASGGGLIWSELVKNNPSGGDYAGVWVAQVPAAAGGGGPARPGQTWLRRFHHRQYPQQPFTAVAAPAVSAFSLQQRGVQPGRPGGRARIGGRGLCAAGILATGIGPPAVPAPHQPPAITHPAPHRAQWRAGKGAVPAATPQPFRPVTVYRRTPSRAQWVRPQPGTPPAATPQPFKPVTIYPRAAHRAQWRGGAGPPVAAVQGTGSLQPSRPVTVYRRTPHAAQWRAGRGAPPAATAQPTRPPTIFARLQHRAQWRGGSGPAVVAVQGTGTPQPFKPATVYRRTPHAAIWRTIRGAPPAATRQPFRPVTVYRRILHAVLWRGGRGSPAGPPPAFTIGQLTATDKSVAALTAQDTAAALTADTYLGVYAGTYANFTPSASLSASDTPGAVLTAATSAAAATAAYEATYGIAYGAPGGTLTATDQRTGGPG